MEIVKTGIPDVLIIKPRVYNDDRGYFFESYNRSDFAAAGIDADFLQDNESRSMKGVLRGLHFQKPPYAQGKLVRVVSGAVLDVAVDLRRNSPWFGKWVSVELTDQNKWMCWIPAGFAHGFISLEDNTVFIYKCTNVYNAASEGSVRWNDPDLNINWGNISPVLSPKDQAAPLLRDLGNIF
ncbi:dTDP-4-dehydrorhamnose 3,5-epimerase [bioreactor metagenome]|jgi:dTDP-4-dehydrorhamnose 3,5-epimerase|uniref:dTDP-4-dehydrorhamnose 3,5-epimerase n=1 Tax=bioreactor metagenome TaxID=1076179 RepID=A0A644U2M9_9ZZZZ|nr:dTDP-4-dehydrorhamnose 3,5-epimerase [Lentimicrobium sp.]MEA5109707.1 dTDP-4-dehydrorhamnose 3,5-epimerase [Lentimicrobium sp.]